MNKMMTNKTRFTRVVLAAAVVLTLAACGGGGGGPTPETVPTTPTPKVLAAAELQPLLPSSYAAGSPQEFMFNQLNAARMKCGFGALRHDTRLNKSAQNHADWLARNNYESSHTEVAGTPGFTGVGSYNRMLFVGYNGFSEQNFPGSNVSSFLATEGISWAEPGWAEFYKSHIPGQLSTVYHALGALGPFRDIGFGLSRREDYGFNSGSLVVHNLGSELASQKLAEESVSTYPCDGVTGLQTFHGNEIPNPLAPRDLNANPPGHPIMVMSRWGTKLTDMKFTMVKTSTGAVVNMAAMRTAESDTSGLMMSSWAFAIPDQELEKNTSYGVKVTGKVDGVAFEKSFSFTTGKLDKAAERAGRFE
jgi:hypothetical protein